MRERLITTQDEAFIGRQKIKLPASITDNQFRYLVYQGYLTNVRQLDLSWCRQITDSDLDRKAVAIYGSTSPQFTPPLGQYVEAVIKEGLYCSPCFKRKSNACLRVKHL